MKKKIVAILGLFFLGVVLGWGQTTAVSATVVDSDGTTWFGGTWKITFIPNSQNPNINDYNINGTPLSNSVLFQSGSMDGSGNLSFSIYQSTAISPAGSSWRLDTCPRAVTACGTYNFTTSTNTLNLSSNLHATIPPPRFHAISGTYGYNDPEAVLQLLEGNTYYDVTQLCQKLYDGTTWACIGGGGGGGPTLQTNEVNNISQALLDFKDTATIKTTNPSGGIEQFNCNTTNGTAVKGCPFIPLTGSGAPVSTCNAGNVGQEYYDINSTITNPIIYICKVVGITFLWEPTTSALPNFKVNGVDVADQLNLNFINGANFTVSNPSGGTIQGAASGGGSGITVQVEDTTTGVNQSVIDFNSTNPAAPPTFVNCHWQNDTATGRKSCYVPAASAPAIQMDIVPPIPGQFCVVRPTAQTHFDNNPRTVTVADNTSAQIFAEAYTSTSFPPAGAGVNWTFTGAVAAQCPEAAAGTISAIYAYTFNGPGTFYGASTLTCGGQAINPSDKIAQHTSLTGLTTAASINASTCTAGYSNSLRNGYDLYYNVDDVGYLVYYAGAPHPTSTAILIAPPLSWNPVTSTLTLDPSFSSNLKATIIADLPPANGNVNLLEWIFDGTTSTDCGPSAGGGTFHVLCYSDGTNWIPYSTVGVTAVNGTAPIVVTPLGTTYTVACPTCTTSSGSMNYKSITNHLFTGDSLLVVATIRTTTATAATCNGTTCTITDTNSYTPGQWVNLAGNVGTPPYATWSPSCLNFTTVKIATATGSQFTFPEASSIIPGETGCTGSVSGTGGIVQDATNFVPQLAATMDAFTHGGTVTPTIFNYAWPGHTIVTENTNYTALYHSTISANSGNIIVWVGAPGNDFCPNSVGSIQAAYQGMWQKIHADGGYVIQETTPGGPNYSGLGCGSGNSTFTTIQSWLRAQKCNITGATQCWDQISDVGSKLNSNVNADFVQASGAFSGHLTDGGTQVWASNIATTLFTKTADATSGVAGLGSNIFTGGTETANAFALDGGLVFSDDAGTNPGHMGNLEAWKAQSGWSFVQLTNGVSYCLTNLGTGGGIYVANPTVCLSTGTGGINGNTITVQTGGGGPIYAGNPRGDLNYRFWYADPQTSDPGSPIDGQTWYNTTTGLFKQRHASSTVTFATTITGGSITITGATQGANSCSTPASVTITGLTTSGPYSRVVASYTSDPTSLTGWAASGGMTFKAWPFAADTAKWIVCNETASPITFSTITFGLGAN